MTPTTHRWSESINKRELHAITVLIFFACGARGTMCVSSLEARGTASPRPYQAILSRRHCTAPRPAESHPFELAVRRRRTARAPLAPNQRAVCRSRRRSTVSHPPLSILASGHGGPNSPRRRAVAACRCPEPTACSRYPAIQGCSTRSTRSCGSRRTTSRAVCRRLSSSSRAGHGILNCFA